MKNNYPYMTEIMRELLLRAKSAGFNTTVESSTGMVMTINNDSAIRVIMGADLGLNFSAADRLCSDKYFAANILQQAGLNTIESQILNSTDSSALAEVAFPCIVKPNKGMGGDGLSSVNSMSELGLAIEFAHKFDTHILIQERHTMREFRMVVLDGKLLYGYEKSAWKITGDGQTSLAGFISQYNMQVTERYEIPLDDTALNANLLQAGMALSTVLRAGEVCDLFANANLKKGAKSFSVARFAPEYIQVVVKACSAMGLRYGGVDLFANDPAVFDDNYRIIEVNSNPGFEYLRRDRKLLCKVLDTLAEAIFAF